MVEQDHAQDEFKTLTVTDYNYFVGVYAVIGLPNDEGTLAEVYGRTTLSWRIGKRGGIVQSIGYKSGKERCQNWFNTWADAFRRI